jgi:AmmeMemoRadiSam system protein A
VWRGRRLTLKKRNIDILGLGRHDYAAPFLLLIIWAAVLNACGEDIRSDMSKTRPERILTHEKKGEEVNMTDIGRLTDEDGRYLISIARDSIERKLFKNKDMVGNDSDLPPKFLEKRGTFVTITLNQNLRGCIGHIIPQESLIEGVRINALNAAFHDPRFKPLSKQEWEKIKIEVSILTEPQRLFYSDADDLLNRLRKEIDGVIIKKGHHQATFLPQVWGQLPDKEEFLTHLCLKAGLSGYEWKQEKLAVFTYQVQAFEEH